MQISGMSPPSLLPYQTPTHTIVIIMVDHMATTGSTNTAPVPYASAPKNPAVSSTQTSTFFRFYMDEYDGDNIHFVQLPHNGIHDYFHYQSCPPPALGCLTQMQLYVEPYYDL